MARGCTSVVRAVTVRANEAGSDPAGSGLVRPGDYVDVLVTLKSSSDGAGQALGAASVVLLQRVLVLAVGSQTEPQAAAELREARPAGHARERELTLSLKTEEVQLLSLARERGVLSVALRDPTDTQIVEGIPDMSAPSRRSSSAPPSKCSRASIRSRGRSRCRWAPR